MSHASQTAPQIFSDHFAAVAAAYADFRPRYPAALLAWLAEHAPARTLAWDCATGSGQAALDLAPHFARVIATDASAAQIATAPAHPGVEYRLAPAEASGLADASIDLITVAQALHWFDLERFYAGTTGAQAGRATGGVELWRVAPAGCDLGCAGAALLLADHRAVLAC